MFSQLKVKLFEPPKSPKKTRRSLLFTPTPKKAQYSNYSFTVHSLSAEDIPYVCLPFNPWIQAEVGSAVHKTSRQLYVGNFVKFPDEMHFEINSLDLEAGIEVSQIILLVLRS